MLYKWFLSLRVVTASTKSVVEFSIFQPPMLKTAQAICALALALDFRSI